MSAFPEGRRQPKAERPELAPGYGIRPIGEGRLVAWDEVSAQLTEARNYWIASASPSGVPHAAPVWGVWHQGAFYFGTDPVSRKGKNSAANPAMVLHLESGDQVVIIEGDAVPLTAGTVPEVVNAMYLSKYGFGLQGNPVYRMEPRKAFAWSESDFPESATRWRFS